MSGMFWEETAVLVVVILSVPALVYALYRLTGRRFDHKLVILLLYVVIFSIFLEINERRVKHQPGEDTWLPQILVRTLSSWVNRD
ncbi:MAG: hypothetical protein HZC18_03520 [Candidatus Omnitrophica bacterium]|nr:hypothetical protein [Candidatus Omnitrophota bacterium]